MRVAALPLTLAWGLPGWAQPAPADCVPTTFDDLEERVAAEAAAEPQYATGETLQPVERPPLAPYFDGLSWDGAPPAAARETGEILAEAFEELEAEAIPPEGCLPRNPLGDSVYIRSPGAFPGIPAEDQRKLVAADIARTLTVASRILDDLRATTEDPLVRYRADLEILLRLMRTPDRVAPEAFEAQLNAAWTSVSHLPPLAPGLLVAAEADLHFARGWACLRWDVARPCLIHFDAAIEADPFFAAARQARIELLDAEIQRVSAGATASEECEALQSQIILDIDQVLSGVTEPDSKVQVALTLDAAAGPANPVLLLAAVLAYRAGGALSLAAAAEEDLRVFLQSDHPCNAVLRSVLDDIL